MFEYRYDEENGALVIDAAREQPRSIREPRPVWWEELDRVGFGEHFDYPRDPNSAPIMWAELNRYYYRGRRIATLKAKGRDVDSGFDLVLDDEFHDRELKEIDLDAMNALNEDGIDKIENAAGARMRKSYARWQENATFYVAFSGGKDSDALLAVAQEALPSAAFSVLFADTGMEAPETYESAREAQKRVEATGTKFIVARAPFEPLESWRLFAPPSRQMRWCCSVHKSAPQTNAIREIMKVEGKQKSVAFCGVRWAESPRRSTYDFETDGVKVNGQVSSYPILDWSSGEVWAYLFKKGIPFNRSYRYGVHRVGCLVCPMTNGQAASLTLQIYPKETKPYVELIERADKRKWTEWSRGYFYSNGWRIRKNGNFLTDNTTLYRYDKLEDGGIVLRSERRTTDWREWFKILGRLEEKRRSDEANEYGIEFKRKPFDFSVGGDVERFDKPIEFHVAKVKGDRTFKSRLKMLVRRATFCVACRNCEANCPHGAISFVNGQVHISDACVHCYQCMTTDNDGCVRYQSLRKSKAYEDE